MEPEEEDALNNSSSASVKEPEVASDLEMITTQSMSDAAPRPAVFNERVEDEVVVDAAADGNEATMDSLKEEEEKEAGDNVAGKEGGGVVSGERNQVAGRESEACEGKRHDEAANDTVGGDGVAEVVEEVAVTAVTGGGADSQIHATAVQDGADVGEKAVDGREQEDDDVSKDADAAAAMEIHEETAKGSTEVSGVIEEEAEKNGIAVAAEEVRMGNSEDDNEAEVAEVATAGDDNEVEMEEAAEDTKVLHEETDTEEETDTMEEKGKVDKLSRSSGGQKRKMDRTKGTPKVARRRKMEEDVCFICFDGGDLVLCDRRKCPKAYHPSCVNRDEAFFRTKGLWFCGWHLCSRCEKNAYYMCYTCTFSLCKNCIRDSVIFCLRGKKGFCESCMGIVKLIEDNLKGDKDMDQVDFDDRSSWEFLFKDYYMELKENLSITLEEISGAKNPWRGSGSLLGKQESPDEDYNVNGDRKSDSENSSEKIVRKRWQSRRLSKSHTKERNLRIKRTDGDADAEWASKELLEFVMHMKNGERTILSQFDVQALLLEYITQNNLRDPRRKSHIFCDKRLENLFGKPRVGHFEMLKLIESHYLAKEDPDGQQDTVLDQLEVDGNADVSEKASKDKKRKTRKRGEGRAPQADLDGYAAIDTHNINLIYVRRNLLEHLIEDTETFHDKVVGSFVRVKIPCSNQNQELYRVVPVVGTSKASEPYKVGKRMTDFLLEVLNLNKTEVISIAMFSNQEFTEEECKRLRQSIKFGLISRLTVGDIHEKAMALQAVRVKDWLESEMVRLSHLRDRASDLGRRKELRECVEKLKLLKTPEERRRRLEEIPKVRTDPKMDPSYESENGQDEADDKIQESYEGSSGSSFTGSRSQTRNLSGKAYPNEPIGSVDTESSGIGAVMVVSETKALPVSVGTPPQPPSAKFDDSDKIWHYQDPSGKIQGPFSMNQLRKWNGSGYFPADLRIWRTTEKQEESVLLTDALTGRFQKDPDPRAAASGRGMEVKLTALNLQSLVQSVRNQTVAVCNAEPVPAPVAQTPSWFQMPGKSATGWETPVNPIQGCVQPQRSNRSGGGYMRTAPGSCKFFFENGHCKKGSNCNYKHS